MTDTTSVLVVEDEGSFIEALEIGLSREGFKVTVARDGAEALDIFDAVNPDLVLLDVMLPKVSGIDVCRELRSRSNVPIIMVTAKGSEIDTVVGLEVGADDYVTKPFSPRELAARVEALLRRPRFAVPATAERTIGHVIVRVEAREVETDGQLVELTRIEFDLLDTLSASPKVVFTRAHLLERVWGPDWYADDHVVDVHVANLRKKIDRPGAKSVVRTVRGVGYGITA